MYRFHVPGMKCGGCLGAVTRILQALDPHARVEGDLERREVTVTSAKDEASLLTALDKAGYPARTVSLQAQ